MRSLMGWGQCSGTEWMTSPDTATQIRVSTIFGPWGKKRSRAIGERARHLPGRWWVAPIIVFSTRHIFRLTTLSNILTPIVINVAIRQRNIKNSLSLQGRTRQRIGPRVVYLPQWAANRMTTLEGRVGRGSTICASPGQSESQHLKGPERERCTWVAPLL